MKTIIREYLKTIGSKGGKKSRRTLTTEQAKKMVEIRESKRKLRKSINITYLYAPENLAGLVDKINKREKIK